MDVLQEESSPLIIYMWISTHFLRDDGSESWLIVLQQAWGPWAVSHFAQLNPALAARGSVSAFLSDLCHAEMPCVNTL